MRNDYEMVTVKAYVVALDNKVNEEEVSRQVEKYLLSVKRAQTNAKIVEALLA